MNLTDLISSAPSNPDQQANEGELGAIVGTLRGPSAQHGLDLSTTHALMSTVGDFVRTALQQQHAQVGREGVQAIARDYAGTTPDQGAVALLFSADQQQHIAQAAARRVGVDPGLVMRLLPVLVPVVLKLLHTGSSTQPEAHGANPLLSAFLAGGQGDNMDLGGAFRMLGGLLGSSR